VKNLNKSISEVVCYALIGCLLLVGWHNPQSLLLVISGEVCFIPMQP
jgi:hypothetical protein